MDEMTLLDKEEELTTRYQVFLLKVQEAFNAHCDRIKAEAEKRLETIPESDQEARKAVLDEQKHELDKTLAELKQLLNSRAAELRVQLEEIANLRDRQEFNVDEELAAFGAKTPDQGDAVS